MEKLNTLNSAYIEAYRQVITVADEQLKIDIHQGIAKDGFKNITARDINKILEYAFNNGETLGQNIAAKASIEDMTTYLKPVNKESIIDEYVDQVADRTPKYLDGKVKDIIQAVHSAFNIGMFWGTHYAYTGNKCEYNEIATHINFRSI